MPPCTSTVTIGEQSEIAGKRPDANLLLFLILDAKTYTTVAGTVFSALDRTKGPNLVRLARTAFGGIIRIDGYKAKCNSILILF